MSAAGNATKEMPLERLDSEEHVYNQLSQTGAVYDIVAEAGKTASIEPRHCLELSKTGGVYDTVRAAAVAASDSEYHKIPLRSSELDTQADDELSRAEGIYDTVSGVRHYGSQNLMSYDLLENLIF